MITTILTGAGAVLDWDAPTTSCLTEILKNDETFKTKSGVPVGEYLFCLLREKNNDVINFEHIINLVEAIYNYVLPKNGKLQLTATIFTHIDNDMESELFSFCDIYEEGDYGYFYPKDCGVEKCFNSEHQYMNKVYDHFISLIGERILLYEQTANNEKYEFLNENLNKFLNLQKNPWLRFYTTNYDRLPIITSDSKPFEGFSKIKHCNKKYKWSLDIKKILSKRIKNCYYNLHGSIHFNHDGKNIYNEPGKKFFIPNVFQEQISQTGETLLRSSIVSGMNKSSRILFSPHQQFYHSFYNDCMRTDNLIIIGYSFSDIHINQAIKEAITAREDSPIKILVIDYWKNCQQFDELWEKLSYLSLGFNKWDINPEKINKAKGNTHYIFGDGLKSFLESDNYNQIFN